MVVTKNSLSRKIFALQVHHDKSRRIELVTEELLKAKRGDDEESQSMSLDSAKTPDKSSSKQSSPKSDKKGVSSPKKNGDEQSSSDNSYR